MKNTLIIVIICFLSFIFFDFAFPQVDEGLECYVCNAQCGQNCSQKADRLENLVKCGKNKEGKEYNSCYFKARKDLIVEYGCMYDPTFNQTKTGAFCSGRMLINTCQCAWNGCNFFDHPEPYWRGKFVKPKKSAAPKSKTEISQCLQKASFLNEKDRWTVPLQTVDAHCYVCNSKCGQNCNSTSERLSNLIKCGKNPDGHFYNSCFWKNIFGNMEFGCYYNPLPHIGSTGASLCSGFGEQHFCRCDWNGCNFKTEMKTFLPSDDDETRNLSPKELNSLSECQHKNAFLQQGHEWAEK